jgi:hypothetical protein
MAHVRACWFIAPPSFLGAIVPNAACNVHQIPSVFAGFNGFSHHFLMGGLLW